MSSFQISRTKLLSLVALCAIVVLVSMPVAAQERFGNIAGSAKDSSGALLPDVTVTITNKATDRSITIKTRGDGTYTAPDVDPGRYSVRFEKSGFSRYELADVLVLVGRTIRVEAQMEVGALEQVVQVTEAAPLIDTSSTMIAHNVSSEEFDRLPKGRNFLGLATTATSVNTGAIEGGLQVNGASSSENNYYIDGVSTTSLIDGRARQTAVYEYLQEVQVKTTGLEAEYGGALGGVVSGITKSGGNDFHGEVHYYMYGNRLSAGPPKRLELDPIDEQTVTYVQDGKHKRDNHELGASLGGPFIKNKLWFFASVSPRWQRAAYDYLFDNGTSPWTLERKANYQNAFGKVSYDPVSRVRTNFSWLYTPSALTGSLPVYSAMTPNSSVTPLATAKTYSVLGMFQPEQSYTGNVDITLTNTSLLSIRGGRYYLNFKDKGVPDNTFIQWMSPSIGMAGVPAELQQVVGYRTPNAAKTLFDTTTRTYIQADFSQFVNFGGQHNFKAGIGTQKNVNRVEDSTYGPNGMVRLYWDTAFTGGDRGTYGYYEVRDSATRGSTGANLTHIYFQDAWRVHPRLTLNLGLRMEKETIPSFQRHIKEYAFNFGYGDKLAPRLGASFDVFGDGKLKLYGSWGRYYDWTKYELARGTFGADWWVTYYRSLDTLDVFNISLKNMPGRNLWNGVYRNHRIPGFDLLDPEVKPMSAETFNFGADFEIRPQTVFSARFLRNRLVRTIEDMGALDAEGSEVYRYGNPGEGINIVAPASSTATCTVKVGEACGFPMPKPKRIYDALELSLSRRFTSGWLANVSYVYSKLWGNYAGLQSSDEFLPGGWAYSSVSQQFGGDAFRPGGNANRYYDLDQIMWDANGNLGPYGRLATDRPHVFKFYGAKQFRWGTEVGGFYRISSGTPVTTMVGTTQHMDVYPNGRGDMGRTPVFSQTDLVVAHEFKVGEAKRLRFEFNMFNLFNQKTSQWIYSYANRSLEYPDTSGIDLTEIDMSKGYNYKQLLLATPDAAEKGANFPNNPMFGKEDHFAEGFSGRFGVKFSF